MKIACYEVPVTLKRNETTGEVDVTLHEDQKRRVQEESVSTNDPQMIPNIAKSLSDHNSTQLTLIKGTMLIKEKESKGVITFKYLE